MTKRYYVYIATNKGNRVLYTGVTNNPEKRMFQHKEGTSRFTRNYNVNKLLYCEEFETPIEAITAEKMIKGWVRIKKLNLVRKNNPEFKDLLSS